MATQNRAERRRARPVSLVQPRVTHCFTAEGRCEVLDHTADLAGMYVGQVVAHTVAAPGCGRITYRITRIDQDGAWGQVVADTTRELSPAEVR